jgi:hypothetical protein
LDPEAGWDLTAQANLVIALLTYQYLIPGVPSYLWHDGCGPTAGGMILGYYDSMGYDMLLPGDASTQTPEVNQLIASERHYLDYALPMDGWIWVPDQTEQGGHWEWQDVIPDISSDGVFNYDCLADFMHTSQSAYGVTYGVSEAAAFNEGIIDYVEWISQGQYVSQSQELRGSSLSWNELKTEINASRPMAFVVDSDADGQTDHIVTVIGYCEVGGARLYACQSTWDNTIWWANYDNMHKGNFYGVYAGVTFSIGLTST